MRDNRAGSGRSNARGGRPEVIVTGEEVTFLNQSKELSLTPAKNLQVSIHKEVLKKKLPAALCTVVNCEKLASQVIHRPG